ncbi:MAG TPA: diguanylate cyclase [Acidimicrobiales bacterium]|nr:diguanylate cyclase [Acidimicrobiales bacterium]
MKSGIGDMDRRAWPGLLAGLIGLALGIAGGVFSNLLLGVLAGAAALVACAAALSLLGQLHEAEAALADQERLMSLETTLRDSETGLPDDAFFRLGLESRVAVARRNLNPMSVVLLELVLDGRRRRTGPTVEVFVEILRQTLRESDMACRVGPSTFAIVLDDTPEEGGVQAAERIREGLARTGTRIERLAAGVATYPMHALTVDELVTQARAALTRATAVEGVGSVEVAPAD